MVSRHEVMLDVEWDVETVLHSRLEPYWVWGVCLSRGMDALPAKMRDVLPVQRVVWQADACVQGISGSAWLSQRP